jgi:hypothetical protein
MGAALNNNVRFYEAFDRVFTQCGSDRGCQIFLGINIPKLEKYTKYVTIKYTKSPQSIPDGRNRPIGHKIYRYISLQDPSKCTQILIFGLKICHLAALGETRFPGNGVAPKWFRYWFATFTVASLWFHS